MYIYIYIYIYADKANTGPESSASHAKQKA